MNVRVVCVAEKNVSMEEASHLWTTIQLKKNKQILIATSLFLLKIMMIRIRT